MTKKSVPNIHKEEKMNLDQALGFVTGKPGRHPFPQHLEDSRHIAEEGIVLLKNKDNVLPIKGKSVALFGAGAVDTIVCGTGSGYVMAPYVINVEQGLKKAGIKVTSETWLKKFNAASKKANKEDKTLSKLDRAWSGLSILIDEPEVTDAELAEAQGSGENTTDTAIYVVRRNAGEGGDRKAQKGDYYLSDMEESNLKKIAVAFKHTVVVLNTCVMDASFAEEIEGVDGLILMGQCGGDAGRAIAAILTGAITPSGHLTDTWTKKYEDNPASATFAANDGNSLQEDYTEDIFVGYRYFDTFGVDVLYPFGYGLSYTDFDIKADGFTADFESVSLRVGVANTGKAVGKEVVQVYVSKPDGKLVKPYQELVAYAKTKALIPGASDELEITFPTEYLTSYDEKTAAFIMEEGDYIIRLGENARDTSIVGVIRLDETAVIRQVTNKLALDHELNIITPPEGSEGELAAEAEAAVADGVALLELKAADCVTIDGIVKLPEKTPAGAGDATAVLPDVKEGRVSMKDFVDSLDQDVLVRLVAGAANETPHSVPSRAKRKYKIAGGPSSSGSTTKLYTKTLGIPEWKVTDGPAGCHLPYCGVTGWPTGMVIAQTFNDEMARLVGLGIGKELEHYNFSIILGPGMNIHRDPLGGRAFEYFSEDPVISGKMAAAITKGVQSTKGCGVSIKHFATNNQETDRIYENNTVSERALREIYLKGFEICVREADPKTVMTSYNCLNGTHTSSSRELLTGILRGEWGFKGLVMTDWGSQSVKAYDLAAGNDLIMGGYQPEFLKAAINGTPAEFGEDGYVKSKEFKVYGGFFTNVVEYWNSFEPSADGKDEVSTTVAAGVELNKKVAERVEQGIAVVTDNADGSKTVTYKGTERGAYLDIEDVKECASRTLGQLMDSVGYYKM